MKCPRCAVDLHEIVSGRESDVWGCACGYEVIFRDGEVFRPPESPVSESRPQWDDDLIGVVSGSCFIDTDHLAPEDVEEIKKELTLVNESKDSVLRLFTEMGGDLIVPRDYGLQRFGLGSFHNNMVMGEKADIEFLKQLDPNRQQPRIVEEILDAVKPGKGGIAQAPCGTGKTVMGLYCLAQWKRSSIILVHSEFLGEQWLKAIKDFLGLDASEIGWVQGDRCDFRKRPITLAMVESLALAAREKREDYPKDFYSAFGAVLADEVHRYAADTWHLAVGRFPAAYRLGLSATPKRADHMEPVIFKHFGPLVSQTEEYQIVPEIFMVSIEVYLNDRRFRKWENGHLTDEIKLSKLVSVLAEDPARNDMLAHYIANALKKGRKIIALSDRLDQLDILMDRVREKYVGESSIEPPVMAKFVGGMKKEARAEAIKAQCIFGTYAIAAEGLDIPDLDTLFMLTPRSNVEQSVGRILRECASKKAPLVVDPVDSIDLCRVLGRKRWRFYKGRGWKVTHKAW